MKKIIYILIAALLAVCSPAYSQIGINTETPDPSAVLDMHSPTGANKGLLLPQMTTVQKTTITNPASGLLVYDTDKNCVSQNIGSEGSPIWTCLTLFNRTFFYMPSINISTTTMGAASIDLYTEYKNQFGTPAYPGSGAPTSIPNFPNATDLYYYITYYDPAIITISGITASGVMNYIVKGKADYDSYMNIVFVVKK